MIGLIIGCIVYGSKKVFKRWPWNLISLLVFATCMGGFITVVIAISTPAVAVIATGQVLSVMLALVIYTLIAKEYRPYVAIGIGIGVMAVILIVFLIIFIDSHLVGIIVSFFVGLFFLLLIIYDLQLIANGRYEELTYDDYIIGAMLLFIDSIGFFMIVTYCLKN
jgi:FtsH-binding integral membrane protein